MKRESVVPAHGILQALTKRERILEDTQKTCYSVDVKVYNSLTEYLSDSAKDAIRAICTAELQREIRRLEKELEAL